jgi:hypothetical protein
MSNVLNLKKSYYMKKQNLLTETGWHYLVQVIDLIDPFHIKFLFFPYNHNVL